MTFYQGFLGTDNDPATATAWANRPSQNPFRASGPRFPAEFVDGTSYTLLVVEAGDPVPWTKPVDLPYDAKKPLPKLGGLSADGFNAAFADGRVQFISRRTPENGAACARSLAPAARRSIPRTTAER